MTTEQLELPDLVIRYTKRPKLEWQFSLDRLPADNAPEMMSPPPDKAFAADIKANGVTEPILVNIAPTGEVLILSGRRRIKAARMAEMKCIPALVSNEPHQEAMRAFVGAANSLRKSNPFSDLQAILHFHEQGYDERAIAAIVRIPLGTVKKRLQITQLSATLQVAARAGLFPIAAAEKAATLSPQRQKALEDILVKEGKLSMQDVMDARHARSADELQGLALDLPEIVPPTSEVAKKQYVVLNGRLAPDVFSHEEALLYAAEHGGDVFELVRS